MKLITLAAIVLSLGFSGTALAAITASPITPKDSENIALSIRGCWENVQIKSQPVVVHLQVEMNKDATLKQVHVVDAEKESYKRDLTYHLYADLAIKELKRCAPIAKLLDTPYVYWKKMTLEFDPRAWAKNQPAPPTKKNMSEDDLLKQLDNSNNTPPL